MVNVINEYCERKRNREKNNKLLEITTKKFKGNLVEKIGIKIEDIPITNEKPQH